MSISLGKKIKAATSSLEWRDLAVLPGRCSMCGPTLFIRLNRTEWGVRCVRCGGAPNSMAIASKLIDEFAPLGDKHICALTSEGPLFEFLLRHAGRLTYSVFDPEVQPGNFKSGVQCQDVQQFTYDDGSFDVCVHSEVFEHVPDDLQGFREILRVLKKGGMTIFTVPLFDRERTVERAILVDGEVKHLLHPVYHNDQMRGKVLAYRDYGRDLINRLEAAGFIDVTITYNLARTGLRSTTPGFNRPVIVGRK